MSSFVLELRWAGSRARWAAYRLDPIWHSVMTRERRYAVRLARLWVAEAREYCPHVEVEVTIRQVDGEPANPQSHYQQPPAKQVHAARSMATARRERVRAEIERRGLAVTDTPMPVCEIAAALGLARTTCGDDIGWLRRDARRSG